MLHNTVNFKGCQRLWSMIGPKMKKTEKNDLQQQVNMRLAAANKKNG